MTDGVRISPPCTSGDRGRPSPSILTDLNRVLSFIEDERHLTAQHLLHDVQRRAKETDESLLPKKSSKKLRVGRQRMPSSNFEIESVKKLLASNSAILEKLEATQRNLNENDEWTFASNHFGITTYYRREKDESLSIKLEGEIVGVPLFEQICVLKEIDLHYKWSPFCSSSLTIADLDKLDTVGWFLIGLPHFGIARDGCFRVIGCDNIAEDGSILLAGKGVNDVMPGADPPDETFLSNDPVLGGLDIPPIPDRRGSGRMTIHKIEAVIHVLSPTSARTRIVANINPNMTFLPQPLLEFVMKHLAGVVLAKLQSATRKILKNPVSNEHARKMRERCDFYEGWLMKKFESICDEKGWQMPPVGAFQLTEQQQDKEDRMRDEKLRRGTSFEVDCSPALKLPKPFENDRSSGDGSVSELSSRSSGTRWTANPITSYMKEMEYKAQQAKAQKVARARKVAADRLVPKEFPRYRRERLDKLKAAKAKRTYENSTKASSLTSRASADSDTVQKSRSFHHRLTSGFHKHGAWVRLFVVSLLISVLFALLHPGLRSTWLPLQVSRVDTWRNALFRDASAFLHLSLAGLVHFIVCDVSMVYAFGTLELGSKTGQEIREFYSENVRSSVAVLSFGICFLSVLKSWLKVWTRILVFSGLHMYSSISAWFGSTMPSTPGCVLRLLHLLTAVLNWTASVVVLLFELMLRGPLLVLWECVGKSNFIGHAFQQLVSGIIWSSSVLVQEMKRNVSDSVGTGGASPIPWTVDCLCTARILLSYSAVFLLLSLLLFSIAAPSSKPFFISAIPDDAATEATVWSKDGIGRSRTSSTAQSETPEPEHSSNRDRSFSVFPDTNGPERSAKPPRVLRGTKTSSNGEPVDLNRLHRADTY